MIQCHRYDIFHICLFLNTALVINLGYMLGIMTRPAVNRQDTLNLLYAETGLLNRPGFGLYVASIYLDCAIGIMRL